MLLPVAAFATDKMLTNAISNAQEKSILKVDLFLRKKKNLGKNRICFQTARDTFRYGSFEVYKIKVYNWQLWFWLAPSVHVPCA